MTVTPFFAQRPEVPAAGSDEDKYWRKEFTVNYEGGSITAARGNILQTLNVDGATNFCTAEDKNVSVKAHPRTNTIGGASKSIGAFNYSIKAYPISRAAQADGGQPITVVTDIGEYTARLSGSAADFAGYLCGNINVLYGATSFVTEKGTFYGPFTSAGE